MKTKPIIAILLVMLFFTCDKFPKLISVKTGTSTNITTTTANIGASIIDAGDGITQYGHCWSKTIQTPTSANCDNKTSLGGRSEIGNFSSDIANLEPGTTYYVAAYALNSKESVTGKAITITTLEIKPPQLTTAAVTNITATTATSGGEITNDGGAAITARGVCWSTSQNPTVELTTKTSDGSGSGKYESSITGLSANTTYYVRAYATNSSGASYGNEVSFTTIQNTNSPTVTTIAATSITQTTAISGGNISSDGGAPVTARGVCWSTSPNPTIDLSTKTNEGAGSSTYVSNITGLSAGTKYYVRAYATDSNGTTYGQQESFTTINLNLNSKIDMVLIDGGTYTMGCTSEQTNCVTDEKPSHQVEISSFYISQFEITQKQWSDVTGINPSSNSGCDDCPVESVSWEDIQGYIIQLNQTTGKKYRLPTEAEWEFAARGGKSSKGYQYSGSNTLSNVAWFINNSSSKTHSVGTKSANELNIYDMSGNVYEWCSDWYGGSNSYSSSEVKDPKGPSSGTGHVFRGGSYYDNSNGCRVAIRYANTPSTRYANLGFRLVLPFSNVESPTVTTTDISSIGQTSATSGGNITSDGGASVIAKGICWSTSTNPSVDLSTKTNEGSGTGTYVSSITGLTAGTKYYVSAYATNSNGTAYGNEVSFTTTADAATILFNPNLTYGSVTDIEGNVYKIIQIGTQVWMAENLKTTKYNNGEPIPDGTGKGNYSSESSPKYYFNYDDKAANINIYGRLYTWNVITDNRGVCPSGYHVPSDAEWTTLENFLGGSDVAGGKLKEIGTSHWNSPNKNADNSFGFTGLPGGIRYYSGGFNGLGNDANYWTTTGFGSSDAWNRYLAYDYPTITHAYNGKNGGMSVRCLKDDGTQTTTPTLTTTAISNIASTSATSGGNITSDGGATITAKGVCWSTSPTPTIDLSTKTNDGSGTSTYVSNITGLSASTKYYVRTYATNSKGTAYGNEVSFTTTTDAATILFNPNLTYGSVTDIEGNVYKTIQIGKQTWMAENLKTIKYNDGTNIPNINSIVEWAGLTTPAYCWYDNDIVYKNTNGALYTWYAIDPSTNGNKSVCPSGWHIPSDAEWTTLTDYLGGESVAGGKMKETGTLHWLSPNTNATNESGFTALPVGYRNGYGGAFDYIGQRVYWWSSSMVEAIYPWYRALHYDNANADRYDTEKRSGFSVRCIKDDGSQTTIPTITTTVVNNIAYTSATSGGNVTSNGGASVTAKGVCWSTSPSPSVDLSTKTNEGSGTGTFVSNITGLTAGTNYYVRSYATNSKGTSYGSEESFTTLSQSSFSFEMVLVEGGTFIMGCTSEQSNCNTDEKPTQQITVSSFYIGKFEVTQKQWRDVMGNDPSHNVGCDNCPVEQVTWDDIQGFITKLNEKTGKTYRLPTEAEWEFAARGGNASKGYQFAGSNTISDAAWYSDNSSTRTHTVGTKIVNELGIYDMSGNVWEWCSDWYGSYSAGSQTDPQGATSGSSRVLRGGSWSTSASVCRLAYRFSYLPVFRSYDFGFRLVLVN